MTNLQIRMMNVASRHGFQTQWTASGIVYIFVNWSQLDSRGHFVSGSDRIAVTAMAQLYQILGY